MSGLQTLAFTSSVNALILSLRSMRNASGLTSADLAHAQGFQECAQLLSNAQNKQLNQLNGFSANGSVCFGDRKLIQERGILNGVPSRKRSLDCMESNLIKKARTDDLGFQPMNGVNGSSGEDQMENMHMEFGQALSTPGGNCLLNGPLPLGSNGYISPKQDQGVRMESSSSPVHRESEIFTVTSMQIPCRCTNSYAYL